MKKLKIYTISILIILLTVFSSNKLFANTKAPENVILSAANSLFADVEKNKKLYEEDITAFYKRVDNVLTPIIDFDVLIKSIIGKKNYQETSSEQKNRFKIALKNQLIRTFNTNNLELILPICSVLISIYLSSFKLWEYYVNFMDLS